MIFGGMGKTAELIIELLGKTKHNISIFDISDDNKYSHHEGITVIHGNICNQDEVIESLKNIDVVLHLAVNISNTKDDKESFLTNVYGTYNVLNGARINRVPKVIIASSAPVHIVSELRSSDDYCCSAGDDFTYDLTKGLQEVVAQHFVRSFNMNCLILRLGHIVDGKNQTTLSGAPLSELSYCRGGWVCKYDVARAFQRGIDTDFSHYNLANIIGSYQANNQFDLSSDNVLSFECEEKFLNY